MHLFRIPCSPPADGEQISPIEDGFVPFDSAGTCRFDIKQGVTPIGRLVLTNQTPSGPFQPHRDHWVWDAQTWPAQFQIHHEPQAPLPATGGDAQAQLAFVDPLSPTDLSNPTWTVWRVRRGELIQGTPAFTNLGYLVRQPNGQLDWHADTPPPHGVFTIEGGSWLDLVQVSNQGLQLSLATATPLPGN